jgi:hypothetical protein
MGLAASLLSMMVNTGAAFRIASFSKMVAARE